MKRVSLLILALGLSTFGWAQRQTIDFDYERSSFNMDQPLPSEAHFFLSGEISDSTYIVEVQIKPAKQKKDFLLYKNRWKRSFNNQEKRFLLPVNYNLHGGTEYDFVINYYKKVGKGDMQQLKNQLLTSLDQYIDQSIMLTGKRIHLLKNPHTMVADMNKAVVTAMQYYQSNFNTSFKGFSNIIEDKIEIVTSRKLRKQMRDDEERQKQVKELKAMVQHEVDQYLSTGFSVLADSRFVNNYQTQESKNTLTVHVGYGGVFLNNKVADMTTGSSGMAGLTLPLGKQAFAPKFVSNTAIILGVYFRNFDNKEGIRATGPIFGRPIYAGFGYKLYEFIRISAGATLLENNGYDTMSGKVDKGIYLRPFVGITADINFWAGFSK